ncbi:CRP-like cAMP-binding protein [Chitinophaga niastensis]|uniref:CRP-like cAMP-binding protein n=1 Tax=Chitinophaga niastensis TaxID=536980 RepID=A0A2P8HVU5_CHINA|nr:Crp/Fnr family transcriptional regulator [Chitinophaga niastensis]PSL50305.1 CRP-like cAMP-binding protein [Chitinophaga niastensis]
MNVDLILSSISQHVRLSPSETDLFTSVLESRTVYKKDYLIKSGEICRHDYFVNKGCLKVCYANEKGIECVTKFAIENWWVVDIDSFLNTTPSFFYYQAVEDTELLQISKANYHLLIEQIPAIQKFIIKRWQHSFIMLQHRFIQSNSLTAEEKYSQFKKKYPGLEQRISLRLTASYLGITPEFLSVLRKRETNSFS